MKVCINLLESKENIAPVIFARRLARELEKQGVKIVNRSQRHDILLAIIRDSYIEQSRRNGAKIIQRLDGIYHNLDQDYERMNKTIKETFELSDSVIYQSEFSKKMVSNFFGKREGLDFVIHNGADPNEFKKSKGKTGKKIFLCSSKWRPMKRLESIVKGFISLNLDSELWVLGETDIVSEDKRVRFFGKIASDETPFFYNQADFFIHLAYDDNCPNSVVEALVSEKPVICTSNGGTPELVKDSGEIIREEEYNLEPYYVSNIPLVEEEKVRESIQKCLDKERTYKFPRQDLYISICAKKYLKVFQKTLDSQMPLPGFEPGSQG